MLDERLLAVAHLVRKDSYFCDVGTDHCYLPCYLVQQGIVKKCIACDINVLPLQSAQKQVEHNKLENNIEVLLSDGLANVTHEVEDIAIAGMGGELIFDIISRAEFLKDPEKRLILQPMTNAPYLRTALCKEGYRIISEIPVIDKNHAYCVMHIQYCGKPMEISTLYSVVGEIPKSKSSFAIIYMERQLARVGKILAGLNKSNTDEEDIERYLELAKAIELAREDMVKR